MENNTALVLKQDGNIYVMNMPEYSFNGSSYRPTANSNEQIEQALSSAVLCDDQKYAQSFFLDKIPEYNHPYVIPRLTFTVKPRAGNRFHCPDCVNCNCKLYAVALLSLQEKTESHSIRCSSYTSNGLEKRGHKPGTCDCKKVEEKTEKQTKNFKDITNEQFVIIAKLALEDIINMEFVCGRPVSEVRIERKLWNTDPDLEVVRIYLHGLGDTHCAVWEVDDENKIDITVVQDKDIEVVANIVQIVKLLIEWEFV